MLLHTCLSVSTTPSLLLYQLQKAFIVTRFADLGFLIGILVLSYYTGTFNFTDLTSVPVAGLENVYQVSLSTPESVLSIFQGSAAPMFMGASVLTWALVLIFMGGMGKSAMMPLHIWLPDAMEGPTPVSALIHAATMVVAGVYLVARLFPLYLMENSALVIITVVGALTAFYAAMVACAQIDIKRVLAFSTISQIAFMMVSLGVARPGIPRRSRLHGVHVPPLHPRNVQGPPVPWCRCAYSRYRFKRLYRHARSA